MSHDIPGRQYEQNYEYPVDLLTDEWTEKLRDAPLYKKTAIVHIRPAVPGERIITRLADGSRETENVAGEDQVVITNPGGEEQILDFNKAVQRYELTDTAGLFYAKGIVRAVDNPFGHPISIRAPWGSMQRGDAACKIAALYDPSESDVVSVDRYIIGRDEFIETYGTQPVSTITNDAPLPTASIPVLRALEMHARRDVLPDLRVRVGRAGLRVAALTLR